MAHHWHVPKVAGDPHEACLLTTNGASPALFTQTPLLLLLYACNRLDPSSSHHGAYVDDQGILHYHHIDATAKTTTVLLSFQLQYSAGDGMPYEPISKPWAFEFVPGMPGDVLLVQEGSCRILYASFPKQGAESSDVFLFGSHTGVSVCSTYVSVLHGMGVAAKHSQQLQQQQQQQEGIPPNLALSSHNSAQQSSCLKTDGACRPTQPALSQT